MENSITISNTYTFARFTLIFPEVIQFLPKLVEESDIGRNLVGAFWQFMVNIFIFAPTGKLEWVKKAFCCDVHEERVSSWKIPLSLSFFYNFRHGSSPVNLLHVFRTRFYKNTYGRLLLAITSYSTLESWLCICICFVTLQKKIYIAIKTRVRNFRVRKPS